MSLPRSNVLWDLHIHLSTVRIENISSPVISRNKSSLSNLKPVCVCSDSGGGVIDFRPEDTIRIPRGPLRIKVAHMYMMTGP